MKYLLFLALFFSPVKKTYYHSWVDGGASPVIEEWNIQLNDSTKYYIIEISDSLNRVVEIRFMNRDSLFFKHMFIEAPLIKYSYEKHKIVETRFQSENEYVDGTMAGLPYQTTYFLDNNKDIINMSYKYYVDTSMHKDINYKEEMEWFKNNPPGITRVWYYYYTISRYNGIVPQKKGYNERGVSKPFFKPPPANNGINAETSRGR